MRYDQISSPEQGLEYIVSCTLATVESLALKKSRPKGEYQRQIGIAQKGVDLLKKFNVDLQDLGDFVNAVKVKKYVKNFEVN